MPDLLLSALLLPDAFRLLLLSRPPPPFLAVLTARAGSGACRGRLLTASSCSGAVASPHHSQLSQCVRSVVVMALPLPPQACCTGLGKCALLHW